MSAVENANIASLVRVIVGQAAYDAADFKLSDPSSVTTVADCVPSVFADRRELNEGFVAVGSLTPAAKDQLRQRWERVRLLLRELGYGV